MGIDIENAFDYYWAQVHRLTVHAHVDSQPEMALYGDHIRQNLHIAPYGWRRRHCSRGGPYTDRQMLHLFKYTIFPNTMVNVLPYHLTVMRFWPDGVGRTRLHYAFCKRRGAGKLEWLRAHGAWLGSRIILAEDVRMLERCQHALDSDAVPHHLLHDHERIGSLSRGTGANDGRKKFFAKHHLITDRLVLGHASAFECKHGSSDGQECSF